MIDYVIDGVKYSFDYQELVRTFRHFDTLSDAEFLADLKNVLHFAVFVAWLKGLPANDVLSDRGVIHELLHLWVIDDPEERSRPLSEVRQLFRTELVLS